jgi:hypothetical protein
MDRSQEGPKGFPPAVLQEDRDLDPLAVSEGNRSQRPEHPVLEDSRNHL